jgi:TolB-like protein
LEEARLPGSHISAAAARDALDRVLASEEFAAAPRAKRLLRYLVEETLAGRGGDLKEYPIGLAVFDRDPSFDPAHNPVVRVETGRLRHRLERFYLKAGRGEPIVIALPRGGYEPVFRSREDVQRVAPAPDAAGAPPPAHFIGPTVLVLPFEHAGDPSAQMFADGLTFEITSSLHRFRDLGVLGRSTALQHRGATDVLALARRLGADFVVEGAARRTARRVRVQAQVLDAGDGRVLWAARYDRDLDTATIFELETDIAAHVAAAIGNVHGKLFRPELQVAVRKPLATLDAFDGLLIFYDYQAHISPDRHATSRAALERVLEVEPDSASLWAAMSALHIDSFQLGFNLEKPRAEYAGAACDTARRAVDLDAWNPSAHIALSNAAYAHGEFALFEQAGRRALELNPNDSDVLMAFGFLLTCRGEWDEGLALLDRAGELNPEPPNWYWLAFARWHLNQGEYAEALAVAQRADGTDFYWTHALQAMANALLGQQAEAQAAVGRLQEANPRFEAECREELARWCAPDEIVPLMTALRRAGLDC